MSISAWAVTTGEMGMRTQARGLAEAVADEVTELTVGSWPWNGPRATPPWPTVIVSCGRRSARWALGARRASGGRPLTVHVQDPRRDRDRFDLIIAMAHDRLPAAANVLTVATALHDLTPNRFEAARGDWAERFSGYRRPLIGVAIGGSLRGRPFTLADSDALISGLQSARGQGGLLITPSRRTPAETLARLNAAFAGDDQVFIWDGVGDNPYRAILASSDRLVVTSDSVSMMSEALASGHPVEILDLGFARHVGFVQGLIDRGHARRFEGAREPAAGVGPVDAMAEAAGAVRRLLQIRTGVSG